MTTARINPRPTSNIKQQDRLKRGEIRKQAKTLISSRFKDSGQTGYK